MSLKCSSCGRENKAGASFCAFCGKAVRPPRSPATGQLAPNTELQGRYLILRRVGKGGFGAVYEAGDRRIPGKKWAVKELSTGDLRTAEEEAEAVASFRQEAEILAHLSHPNLPTVTDFFSEGGKQYLVMEFVQGRTLQQLLEERQAPFPEAQVLGWAEQLVAVLHYLHSQGPPIIFRDLKPANIMLDEDGRIKLIDFGIARLFKGGRSGDTVAMGTAGYAPPEAYGQSETDARSDVYSLGATLHQLLTGQDPGSTPFNLPPVRDYNPAVSANTAQAITRALHKDPRERFTSMREMQALLFGGSGERPPRLFRYAVAGIFVLLLTAGGIAWAVSTRGGDASPTAATTIVAGATPDPDNGGEATVTRNPTTTPASTATASATVPTATPSVTFTPQPTVTATPLAANQQLVGLSAGGEEIMAYRFGNGPRAIVLVGGLHSGFAPSSRLLPTDLMSHFSGSQGEIPDNVTVHIIPDMNPDSAYDPGYRPGRINANNVDLNRNWDCAWRPDAEWSGSYISGGDYPFSEPETAAVRNYLLAVGAEAVIFYEARASGGLVTPGECNGIMSGSRELMFTYQAATSYKWQEGIPVTGDASNWAAAEGMASIAVILPSWDSVSDADWQRNLSAVRAVLEQYRR